MKVFKICIVYNVYFSFVDGIFDLVNLFFSLIKDLKEVHKHFLYFIFVMVLFFIYTY